MRKCSQHPPADLAPSERFYRLSCNRSGTSDRTLGRCNTADAMMEAPIASLLACDPPASTSES